MTRVIGPTPPGFGAIQAAFSFTAGSTSPRTRDFPSSPVTRETPTSRTITPSLTCSGFTMWAEPAAAITTSALASSSSRFVVPVWARVTVALTSRRVSTRPAGRPMVTPRPITSTCLPASSTPWWRSSSTQPAGVHGSGESSSPPTEATSRPRFMGCRPSASLSGSMASSTFWVSTCFGSGSWTM